MDTAYEGKTFIGNTPASLLEHWQGHRRVTRRVIEVFPEEAFFNYSIGGMRPFADMVMEFIGLAHAGIIGVATGKWVEVKDLEYHQAIKKNRTKEQMLQAWDDLTELIDKLWADIPPQRFNEIDTAFGQFKGEVFGLLQYWIDNEIHHRGQGYVYLRSLGIQPPAFWDRG
jgi:uncharacterized damage-inducible protein DinB